MGHLQHLQHLGHLGHVLGGGARRRPTFAERMAASGPSVWLRLAESSGTTAADASGNGRHGAYVNAPALARVGAIRGEALGAVRLTAASVQRVSVPNFTTGAAAFTVQVWVRVASMVSNQRIISQRDASGEWFDIFLSAINQINLFDGSGTYSAAATPLTTGQWHLVTLAVAANVYRLYLDGVEVKTGAWVNNVSTSPLVVGDLDFATTPLDGWVDEAALWAGTALPAATIRAFYDAGIKTMVTVAAARASATEAVFTFSSAYTKLAAVAAADVANMEISPSASGYVAPSSISLIADPTGSFIRNEYAGTVVVGDAWRITSDFDPAKLTFGADKYLKVPSSGVLT